MLEIKIGLAFNRKGDGLLVTKCRVRDTANQWMTMAIFGTKLADRLECLNLNTEKLIVDIKIGPYNNTNELTGIGSTKIVTFN